MKIYVVYDSCSSIAERGNLPEDAGAEYDDEKTVDSIVCALKEAGHSVGRIKLDDEFFTSIKKINPDIVFNISEGISGRGRESIVPSWLDHAGICYTGSDPLTMALSLDKAFCKVFASSVHVPTPAFHLARNTRELKDIGLDYPLFLKPVGEGSSMGIRQSSVVCNEKDLYRMTDWILREYNQGCLIEEFAPGREFCVGLLGNEKKKVFPVLEVKTSGNFYSYEHKSKHEKQLICPAVIPEDIKNNMKEMATRVYEAIGCRDFARIDFKMDENQKPLFLEINPLPGLSKDYSIYPLQAEKAGISYNRLINNIVDLAAEREEIK